MQSIVNIHCILMSKIDILTFHRMKNYIPQIRMHTDSNRNWMDWLVVGRE